MNEFLENQAFLAALPVAFKELETIAFEEHQKPKAERIKEVAQHYAPVAQGAVPAGESPGDLRKSIQVTEGIEDGKPYVEVGTRLEYANYTEWGTSREGPHHFMIPAIAQET